MDEPHVGPQLRLVYPDLRSLGPTLGLAASLAGLALALGIMAAEAADGTDYTVLSWAAIGPTWGATALLSLAMRWWPAAAGFFLGWVAVFAGLYFSDVFGFVPAAVLFILGTAAVLRSGAGR